MLFIYKQLPILDWKPCKGDVDLVLLRITLLLTIIHFYTKDRFSADMLIPYFIWVFFAGYLNLYIVVNN